MPSIPPLGVAAGATTRPALPELSITRPRIGQVGPVHGRTSAAIRLGGCARLRYIVPGATRTPMKIDAAVNIEDLRRMARRRLPRIAFDYIEGGVEDERCLARNESAFARYPLLPRYLVDIAHRDVSTTLFDRRYALPFGIAPTGLAGLFRAGADLMLAEAAAAANIPFVMSGAATASMEAAARVAPAHAWYQLYCARDPKISEDMIRRARDAGLAALVLTVDIPINAKRERNLRNGFGLPPRLTARTIAEALTHPGWIAEYLRHGRPRFENWAPYVGNGGDPNLFFAAQSPATV